MPLRPFPRGDRYNMPVLSRAFPFASWRISPIIKVCFPLSAILVIASMTWKNLMLSSSFIRSDAFFNERAVATTVRAFSNSAFARILALRCFANKSWIDFGNVRSRNCACSIEFYNTGLGCSDAVQENEEKIREVLYRDTAQITYDHNLLFLENEKGTTLHFYYDPE